MRKRPLSGESVKRAWACICREVYLLYKGMWRGECAFTMYDDKGAVAEMSGNGILLTKLMAQESAEGLDTSSVKLWWNHPDHNLEKIDEPVL